MATVAIGDIHGNLAALNDLLGVLRPELRQEDELVFLGDYVDDGPHVAGCIARILDLKNTAPCQVVALMGNHEQWMLRSRSDHTRHSWLITMAGLRTVMSYSQEAASALGAEAAAAGARLVLDEGTTLAYDRFFDALPGPHLEFFLTLVPFHQSPDVLCVHGGADGARSPRADDPPEMFTWGPPGFPARYEGSTLVVYGHHNDAVVDDAGWPHPRITRGVAFGIDTIRHGVLTAMRFPDRRVFQSRRFPVS